MREGLEQAWTEALRRSARWHDGADPEPVLDALGLALVLAVTGDLDRRDEGEREPLRQHGRAAVREASEQALADPDERDDRQRAIALAKAGLALLEGSGGGEPATGDPLCPSPSRLLRMLDGRMDGLSAGACAAHVMRCARCSRALALVDPGEGAPAGDETSAPMAVAAAEAAAMRPPAEGRVVATRRSPELEAVLFDDDVRRLAVYAARSAPLHVTAEGAITEEMRPGYWIGRLEPAVEGQLEARVHLGDEEVDWRIPLAPVR